jgi:hypothetical protein
MINNGDIEIMEIIGLPSYPDDNEDIPNTPDMQIEAIEDAFDQWLESKDTNDKTFMIDSWEVMDFNFNDDGLVTSIEVKGCIIMKLVCRKDWKRESKVLMRDEVIGLDGKPTMNMQRKINNLGV